MAVGEFFSRHKDTFSVLGFVLGLVGLFVTIYQIGNANAVRGECANRIEGGRTGKYSLSCCRAAIPRSECYGLGGYWVDAERARRRGAQQKGSQPRIVRQERGAAAT